MGAGERSWGRTMVSPVDGPGAPIPVAFDLIAPPSGPAVRGFVLALGVVGLAVAPDVGGFAAALGVKEPAMEAGVGEAAAGLGLGLELGGLAVATGVGGTAGEACGHVGAATPRRSRCT